MKIRRIFAVLLAVAFLFGTASAEGSLTDLYQAFEKMLFETDNVTLSGKAEFTYDDDCFKTISVRYLWENLEDRYQDVDYWTKGKNGKDYVSGYTVLAVDGLADAWDKYDHYSFMDAYGERKYLFNSDLIGVYQNVAALLKDQAEKVLQPFVTVESSGKETTYWVALEGKALPRVLKNTVETGIRYGLSRYLFVHMPEYDPEPDYHAVDYSFAEMMPVLYRETYGEEMPEDFFDRMSSMGTATDEEWDQYGTLYGKCVALVGKAHQLYKDGYSVLKPDGSLDHYATYQDYLLGTESCYVEYEDFDAAVTAFVKHALDAGEIKEEDVTGKTNYELSSQLKMEEYYKQLGVASKAVIAYVREDGTCDLYPTETAFSINRADSVTIGIVSTMTGFELGEVHARITLDEENRIASAEGTVELLITAYDETVHSAVMTFSGTAEDYGRTSLQNLIEERNTLQSTPAPEK